MAWSLTTMLLRAALGTFQARAVDESGTGAGPWRPVTHVIPLAIAYTTEETQEIEEGGEAQNALEANSARTMLQFQNQSEEDLFVKVGGGEAADGDGLHFPPGAYKNWEHNEMPAARVSVWGPTSGQEYFVAEG